MAPVTIFNNVCVAVACGVRLSHSVFMVYSVLLSVSLVARALSIALRLQCVYFGGKPGYRVLCAIAHGQSA